MSSPFIAAWTGEPSGTLRGKRAVGAYWKSGLERIPDLRFELIEVLAGASSITIYYHAVLGKRAAEVLMLDESGRIFKAMAHYNDGAG